MNMPEGWKVLKEGDYAFVNPNTGSVSRFNDTLDLMKEMAEALEYYANWEKHCRDVGRGGAGVPTKVEKVLQKFKEWK